MATLEIKFTDEECMFFPQITSVQMARSQESKNMLLIFNHVFHIEFDGGRLKACKSIYNLIRKFSTDDKKSIYIDSLNGQGWIANVYESGDYRPVETSEPDDVKPQIEIDDNVNSMLDNTNGDPSKNIDTLIDPSTVIDGEAKEVTEPSDKVEE